MTMSTESQTFIIDTHPALLPREGGMVDRAEHDRVVAERDALRSRLSAGRCEGEGPYVPTRSPDERDRRNRETIALLDSWIDEGDEEEQRETMAVLRDALGEDRLVIPEITDQEAEELWEAFRLDARHD